MTPDEVKEYNKMKKKEEEKAKKKSKEEEEKLKAKEARAIARQQAIDEGKDLEECGL